MDGLLRGLWRFFAPDAVNQPLRRDDGVNIGEKQRHHKPGARRPQIDVRAKALNT